MTVLERSLLYPADYLNDALTEAAAAVVYGWCWVAAYVVTMATVWHHWGWYGMVHPEARYVRRHGGVGTHHGKAVRLVIPRVNAEPLVLQAHRRTVHSRTHNLYPVSVVLTFARSRQVSPATVIFPRDPDRVRVAPIRPHELNILPEPGGSVVYPREAIAA